MPNPEQNTLEPRSSEREDEPLSLEFALNTYRSHLESLETWVSSGHEGTNEWPEPYSGNEWPSIRYLVVPAIRESKSVAALGAYYELCSKESLLNSRITGASRRFHPLEGLIGDITGSQQLPVEEFGEILAEEPENGTLHHAILDYFDFQHQDGHIAYNILNTLKVSLSLEQTVELLGVQGSEWLNELHGRLMCTQVMETMRVIDCPNVDGKPYREWRGDYFRWMSQAVSAAAHITIDEASDYVFSVDSLHRAESEEYVLDIINKLTHFGIEEVHSLSCRTGIYGLALYTTEQLEQMLLFSRQPEKLAAQLTNHDVTACFINRFGDYNGTLKVIAPTFDDKSRRTLFFEISSMQDIYRYAKNLKDAGIQPSTLVMAAHSAPGGFIVSDTRNTDESKHTHDGAIIAARRLVAFLNESEAYNAANKHGYSMHSMRGFARIVEEYMKPSRAIDDNKQDEGRKKIIFVACNAGTDSDMEDLNERGERVSIGEASVVTRLAEDLTQLGIKQTVDIYGAPASIQIKATDQGLTYRTHLQDDAELDAELSVIPAVRMHLEDGVVTREEVEEILLR